MGEIRTVKGRERERATAVERVVVTPLREGHCCGASRRNPAETEIARKINAQTASQQAWYVRIGCIRGAACAAYPPTAATLPSHSWTDVDCSRVLTRKWFGVVV
jgi:hypothetical protein